MKDCAVFLVVVLCDLVLAVQLMKVLQDLIRLNPVFTVAGLLVLLILFVYFAAQQSG